ncbi:Flp1 family type IVb pilin [Salinicoccus carnicancri]|uniref:Flp1 family type IVb pilin n=1 Tax=Salinicoccus carnicancri TaxID=558170 RepID=UPI00031E87A7|nr:Flp1 family type IVb pilin [Salinicoccus carnicancri]
MAQFWLDFWNDEEGLEVVEVLLILAVLIGIAIMFKGRIETWAGNLFDAIEGNLGTFGG